MWIPIVPMSDSAVRVLIQTPAFFAALAALSTSAPYGFQSNRSHGQEGDSKGPSGANGKCFHSCTLYTLYTLPSRSPNNGLS